MKLGILFSKISEDPMWIDNNVASVPIASLKIDDLEGQARATGIVSNHVETLVEDILIRGQQVPITIDQNNVVVEGNHRLKAFIMLAKRNPEVLKWKMIRAWRREFENDAERRLYQLECNNHPPAKASTNADLAMATEDDIKGGEYNFTWDDYNSNVDNYDLLVKGISDRYSVNGNRAKAIAKIATSKTPNQKLKNYTKNELFDSFREWNPFGWEGKRSGDEHNNISVYALGAESHIFPNLTGNTFNKKTSNGKVSTVCVLWDSNTHGKEGKNIDKFRQSVVKKINNANKSHLLSRSAVLVDEIFIAPQKIGGDRKESLDKFFKVTKDVNGNFRADKISKKGWK